MTLYAADNLHHSYNADNNINCPPLSVYMYIYVYEYVQIKRYSNAYNIWPSNTSSKKVSFLRFNKQRGTWY